MRQLCDLEPALTLSQDRTGVYGGEGETPDYTPERGAVTPALPQYGDARRAVSRIRARANHCRRVATRVPARSCSGSGQLMLCLQSGSITRRVSAPAS